MESSSTERQGLAPKIGNFTGRGLLYRFVFRAAHNRVKKELQRRRNSETAHLDETFAVANAEDEEALREIKSSIANALCGLTPRERILLRMSCDNRTLVEISKIISSPGSKPMHAGTVSRMRDAIIAKLREQLIAVVDSVPSQSTLISELIDGLEEAGEARP